jgi:predicted PurR-regulated permease PerM
MLINIHAAYKRKPCPYFAESIFEIWSKKRNFIVVSNLKVYNMGTSRLQRLTLFLVCGFLIFVTLYFAKNILVPLVFAMLLSMLMLPVCKRIERKCPRWLAVLCCVFIFVIILSSLATVFSLQIINLADDLPKYKSNIHSKIQNFQAFLTRTIDVSQEEQTAYFKEKINHFIDNSEVYIKNFLLAATGLLGDLALVIIFTFFFLLLRDHFKTFILKVTKEGRREKVKMVISRCGKITGKYLSGVFIVVCILSTINSIGLLIIGLDYAVFFGIMVGMCNMIPYVGVPISAILPVTMAILTKDSYVSAIGVCSVFAIGQFIDNNFLTPNIVGDKVNLNPISTIVVLLIGASLWGIAGMVIFIPLLGVIKIILDNSEDLHPYGYLIGKDPKPKKHSLIARLIIKLFKQVKHYLRYKKTLKSST